MALGASVGDFNNDNVTNLDDLNIVLAGWGTTYVLDDLNALLANWGTTHEVEATGIYSLKVEDDKVYLRVNDTTDANYARIGQIIFSLTDSNGDSVTSGVSLSGSFNDTIYQAPDYNSLITNNWSVTKKVATTTPELTANTWVEILTVPTGTSAIQLDNTYSSIFGTRDMEIHYVVGSNIIEGSDIAPFSNPGIALTEIQVM
tara:strand:+ start:212 stop:817 length:606 start_codon:yes stop_codon:yes gene_type:complete